MSRRRVVEILRGSEASRIRFTFPVGQGTVTIAHRAFLRVARAINHGHVRVKIKSKFSGKVAAEYDYRINTLFTPPVIGRRVEGLVLHECIHVYFDITKAVLPSLDEEAAAYVVGALYSRMSGLDPPHGSNPPYPEAGLVADGLLGEYAAGSDGVPPVDPIRWHTLRGVLITLDPYIYNYGPLGPGGAFPNDG